MLTLKGQRPTSRSDSVETGLLLWWEDFYLPVFEYVLPKMGNLEGKKVLELGTGTGFNSVMCGVNCLNQASSIFTDLQDKRRFINYL